MTLSLSEAQIEAHARWIRDHCDRGLFMEDLPAPGPKNLPDAYAVQDRVYSLRTGEGAAAAGWFASATNAAMRNQLGLPEPYAARWRPGRIVTENEVPLEIGPLGVALEAEVCFELAHDLPRRVSAYETAEVLEAVKTVRPGLEVVVSCFSDWINQRPLNLVAEGGTEQWLILGAPVENWRTLPLADLPVTVELPGGKTLTGSTAQVMDGPVSVLVWLANHAAARGEGLCAGQVCNTGMCAPVYFAAPGERVRADFGPLGQVGVTLSKGAGAGSTFRRKLPEVKGNNDYV